MPVMPTGFKKRSQKNSEIQRVWDQNQKSRWRLKGRLSLTVWEQLLFLPEAGFGTLFAERDPNSDSFHKPAERFINEKPNGSSLGDNQFPAKRY